MRISDWSSDVCSSDLPGVGVGLRRQVDRLQGQQRAQERDVDGLRLAAAAPMIERGKRRLGREDAAADAGDVRSQAQGRIAVGPQIAGIAGHRLGDDLRAGRSEEHTSELQSLMRLSYAVFCLKKKTHTTRTAKRRNE